MTPRDAEGQAISEGDEVESKNGNRYAVREILAPGVVKDGGTLVLLEILLTGSFHPFGRWKPKDVTVVVPGRWASRLDYWKRRDGRLPAVT